MPRVVSTLFATLLPNGPAKSVGTLVPAGHDYFAFPVPGATAPHIGADNGDEIFGSPLPAMAMPARVALLLMLSLAGIRTLSGR